MATLHTCLTAGPIRLLIWSYHSTKELHGLTDVIPICFKGSSNVRFDLVQTEFVIDLPSNVLSCFKCTILPWVQCICKDRDTLQQWTSTRRGSWSTFWWGCLESRRSDDKLWNKTCSKSGMSGGEMAAASWVRILPRSNFFYLTCHTTVFLPPRSQLGGKLDKDAKTD